MKRVLAIILNYNGGDLSARCAETVLRSEGVDADILIVDNASPDGSGLALQRQFGEERLLLLPENRGYAGGMNAGLAGWRERGDFDLVLLLTQDVCLESRALHRLTDALAEHPGAGAVGPVLWVEADATVFSAGGICDVERLVVSHHGAIQSEDPYSVSWLDGCCILLRGEAVDAIGGFDDAYFLYFEDVDFCTRLRHAGWDTLVAPQARAWQAKEKYIPRHTLYYTSRNRYRYWRNNFGIPWYRVLPTLVRELASGTKAVGDAVVRSSLRPELRARTRLLYHRTRGALRGTMDHLMGWYGFRAF